MYHEHVHRAQFQQQLFFQISNSNRPFAAKPSHYLLFITLWAATLRLLEIEKASGKHKNGQV